MPEIWTKEEFKKHTSAGRLARRSNRYIKTIDWALERYHEIDPLEFSKRRFALLVIVDSAKGYLRVGEKTTKRRAGVVAMQAMALGKAEELTRAKKRRARGNWARAVAATKPLRVKEGSGAKPLHEKYWKEMRAPHYAGFVLDSIFEEWKRTKTYKNLDDWVESEWLPMARASKNPAIAGKAIELERNRVKYIRSPNERGAYYIRVRNGRARTASGARFHTGDHRTAFSGQGWAIFVMSPGRHVYSGSHDVGKFHHSTFLGGGPVLSAGEWAVDNGRVVAVTAKSGHYKPDERMFWQMLRKLKRQGVDLNRVAACPKPFENPQKFYNAQDVYDNNGQPGGRRRHRPAGVAARAANVV